MERRKAEDTRAQTYKKLDGGGGGERISDSK
jgi:hypothetical protein